MRYVGKGINPHLFRDILSLAWLEDHPEDFLTLSCHLWHSTRALAPVTLGVYGRKLDESYAARRLEEWLLERYPCLTVFGQSLTRETPKALSRVEL